MMILDELVDLLDLKELLKFSEVSTDLFELVELANILGTFNRNTERLGLVTSFVGYVY